MAEVELTRLNASSFERMIRALAFAEMGPSGTVFSGGPDGARDFICDGKIPGFETRSWDGYLVLQAKFKESLDGGQQDIDWLKSQIEKEFQKFANEKRKLKSPEYFILATNVRLSGTDSATRKGKRVGGHKKVSEAFDKWKSDIHLKDYHIWGGDQIVDLLLKHSGVRQSFAGFVTAGDVLTQVLKQFPAKQKDFSQIIERAIIRRLSGDQYVPLNESGSVDHKKIPTSKVFIDLPASTSEDPASHGFVAQLIKISKSKLAPEEPSSSMPAEGLQGRVSANIVLLGGPGQGKSTTGLFAIQLFRAAIIRDNPICKIDPTISELVPDILTRAKAQGLSIDLPRRFPVHVSLPGYADRITEAKNIKADPPSMLAHIAHDLGRAADCLVEREDLRGWLASYPWLVVLDGLDEVPPSGERPAVIEAIEAFLSEIAQAKADVLVVVTSRPQGYNKDLSEKYWRHWTLVDLASDLALSYAEALSLAQHPLDPDRRNRIIVGLRRAMQQPATARLMVSPLQVTIMHLIIDGGGSAPVGRWALFNEYYQVLKKREKAKGGETQEVLERNWDHLDPVHHRAGLLLQAEAEMSGGATAQFNPSRLKVLISSYLKSCGYETPDRDVRAEELKRLALNRLVLLSMRQQGKTDDEGSISFDVRSLQEFMAAAELTTESESVAEDLLVGRQPKIEDRLTHIAGIAHWRHVFLIAASRCFSETALHHLRSTIVAIPRTLDTSEADRLSRTGARLALEMLADGIGSNHPISRCKLVEHAMDLLDLGPENCDDRLASICSNETVGIFEERLKARLSEGTTPGALSAWRLLAKLIELGEERFLDLAERSWPKNRSDGLKVLVTIKYNVPNILLQKGKDAIAATPFMELDVGSVGPISDEESLERLKGLEFISALAPGRVHGAGFMLLSSDSPLRVLAATIESPRLQAFTEDVNGWDKSWGVLKAAADFTRSPSVETLAGCIDCVTDDDLLKKLKSVYGLLPWTLETLLQSAQDVAELKSMADKVRAGSFGDRTSWSTAESRWKKYGISREDISESSLFGPFVSAVDTIGSPMIRHLVFSNNQRTHAVVLELNEIAKGMNEGPFKANIQFSAKFAVSVAEAELKIPGSTFLEIFEHGRAGAIDVQSFCHLEDEVWEDDAVVDRLARVSSNAITYWVLRTKLNPLPVIEAFNRVPTRRSLLYLIAYGLLYDASKIIQCVASLPESAFQYDDADDWRIKGAVAILRILKSRDISCLAVRSLVPADNSISFRRFLDAIFELEFLSREEQEALAVLIVQRLLNIRPAEAWWPRATLKKILDARKSGFNDRHVWIDRLRLPPDAFNVITIA